MRKSTRKSFTGPAEVLDSAKNFSTRFSLTSFMKRVRLLTDEQRSAIKETGFGYLLLIPNFTLSKNLLVELMERWNCEKRVFVLRPGEIPITLLDIALILGLPVVGNPVVLKDDEPFSELEKEYGASIWKRKITIASIESRLDSHGGSICVDFIRAFLLYTLGTFLFPNSNGKIDSRYLSFLRNLDDVSKLDWGAAVREDISTWLGRRKENNVQYVGGCLLFLQIWSYEHFDIARPSFLESCSTFPRMCRWDNSKSHHRQWFTSKFKDLHIDQVIWTLQPTCGESQVDIIKEALGSQNNRKELQREENCSTSTPIVNVAWLEPKLEISTLSEIHEVVQEMRLQDMIASHHVEKVQIGNCLCKIYNEQMGLSLILQDSPTEKDDSRTRVLVLEKQNMELKKEIDQLKEVNGFLQHQISLNSGLEEQNVELKKELDNVRGENQILGLSLDGFVVRLERLLSDVDLNAKEQTLAFPDKVENILIQ